MSLRQQWFRADVAKFVAPAAAPRGPRLLARVLSEPGLQFVWLARWQMYHEGRGRHQLARLLHLLNLRTTGAEFGHGCVVGGGFVVKHPLGLVVGSGTQIGQNCIVLHNVTFGERRPDEPAGVGRKTPRLGDDCLIGTGAVLLGDIILGHGAKVGAGSVVLNDVGPGVTVVGSPAKAVR